MPYLLKYTKWVLLNTNFMRSGHLIITAAQANSIEFLLALARENNFYAGRKWIQDDAFPAVKQEVWDNRIKRIGVTYSV